MKLLDCIILLNLVSLVKVVSCQLPAGQEKSWGIRSVINVVRNDQLKHEPEFTVKVYESYSYKYQQKVIEYDSLEIKSNEPDTGEFLISQDQNNREIFLLRDKHKNTCETSNKKEFFKKLRLPDISMIQLKASQISEQVFGPVRLLFFVWEHRTKLKLVDLKEKVFIRNIHCLQYNLNFKTDQGIDIDYTVFYSASAIAQNVEVLPIQMIIPATDGGSIFIDFSRISYLKNLPGSKSIVEHDRFVLPMICVQVLSSQKRDDLAIADQTLKRFSFEATIETTAGLEHAKIPNLSVLTMFAQVNYDSDLKSLRVNKRRIFDKLLTYEVSNYKTQRTYLITPEEQSGIHSSSSQDKCTVFATPTGRYEKSTTRQMLFGVNDLVLLGRAYVRGIAANLYATTDGSIPAWLDQPVEYKYGGKTSVRDPDMGAQPDSKKKVGGDVTILIYLSDQEQPHLLYMSIQHDRKLNLIEVFNFNWDIDHSEATSEMFSVHESCSSLTKAHNHASLFLHKEKAESLPEKPGQLMMELTLLSNLQNTLLLPATMVYDLQYEFYASNLMLSLNVASYENKLASLIYLGRGKRNYKYTGAMLIELVQSFQMCYQMVAKRDDTLFFAYDVKAYTCTIDLESDGLSSFILASESDTFPFEIYQVRRRVQEKSVFAIGSDAIWLDDQMRKHKANSFLGHKLKLYPYGPGKGSYDYTVKDIKFHSFEPEDPRFIKSSDVTVNTNSFIGFALIESAENRKILVPSSDSRSWTSKAGESNSQLMSFSQCKSACMSDPDCNSFSVCQRDYQVECIISKLDFRPTSVIEQLVQIANETASSSARQRIVQVTLGDKRTTVQLERRPFCELHNKIYLNLFHAGLPFVYTLGKTMLQQVRGAEGCAKLCVEMNMLSLSENAKLSRQLREFFTNAADLAASEDQLHRYHQVMKSRDEISKLFCKEFLYLDKSQIPVDETVLKEIEERTLDSSLEPDELGGLCQIAAYKGNFNTSSMINSATRLNFRRFEFNLEHFYEGIKGVRLRASPLSDEDALAYDLAKYRSKRLNITQYQRLQNLIESGHNFQEVFFAGESRCAALCLTGAPGQAMVPWPSCRSYDIEVDKSLVQTCYLNSRTLQDVISNENLDLVVEKKIEGWAVTHFEPNVVLQDSMEDEAYELIELELQVNESFRGLRLQPASLVITSLLAICCGLFLGIHLAPKLITRLNQTNETTTLKARLTECEFTNQVNADGAIPD